MGIVVEYVEFHGSDKLPLQNVDRKFRAALRYCFVVLALLLTIYFVTVTLVPDVGGPYVTGFTGGRDSRCQGMSSALCIRQVTHDDEANIDLVFGEKQIRLAKALFVFSFAGFLCFF